MGLAKSFNKALRKQANIYVAWLPVTNTYQVGDYGIIQGGTFQKIGNVSQLGATVETAKGPSSQIDFVSEGVRTGNLEMDGHASNTPVVNGKGKLKFSFEKENSCILKAKLDSIEMSNIHQVAKKIKDHPDWERRFKVVSATFKGKNCVIIGTSRAGTEITLTGDANVLKGIEAGAVNGDVGFSSSNSSYIKSIGKSGVIGLKLFKINIFGKIKARGEGGEEMEDLVEIEENLGDDLENDI